MNARTFRSFVKTAMALQTDNDTPADYHLVKTAVAMKYGLGKTAGIDALELAGLGTLAAPAVAGLSGHHMKEKHKDVAEVAGLGILAAPYAHNIAAKRSARYAASGVGERLGRIFSH